jgi:hypothetical protein
MDSKEIESRDRIKIFDKMDGSISTNKNLYLFIYIYMFLDYLDCPLHVINMEVDLQSLIGLHVT